MANWGSHWLEFRVPKRLLDPDTVSMYCTQESLSCRARGEYVVLSFASEDQDGEWAEGEGWLASLTPLRADLMNGDHRCLYLGWLVAVQAGLLDDDDIEPPVPAGLETLNAPLRSLADFLRVDPDVISAAAEESAPERSSAVTQEQIAGWVAAMPSNEKDAVIAALIEGKDSHFAVEFRQRVVREIQQTRRSCDDLHGGTRRNVGQLITRAESIAKERQIREAEILAREKAKRDREQAEQRKKHLESLVGNEEGLWSKVDKLIATKNPKRYDDAVSLLQDLRDVAAMTEQAHAFSSRMEALCREHSKKPTLVERFHKANLLD